VCHSGAETLTGTHIPTPKTWGSLVTSPLSLGAASVGLVMLTVTLAMVFPAARQCEKDVPAKRTPIPS
jgi:hypothetical protein